MSETTPIEQADHPSLRAFAELTLGIEVKDGVNATQLRAKIRQARPDVTEIPVIARVVPAAQPAPADVRVEARAKVPPALAYSLTSPQTDPKVKVIFQRTADKTRSREVTIGCNGYVCRYQRGAQIDIPYRIYLAALDSVERQAVDTDEINPNTGLPFKSWEEVQSYPMQVIAMPSDEEIAAWRAAVDGVSIADDVQQAA
jgi:hypothetical protein